MPPKSLLIVEGNEGCLFNIYRKITVYQWGENVIGERIYQNKKTYHSVSVENYRNFLHAYTVYQPSLEKFYGEERDSADLFASLKVEYVDGSNMNTNEIKFLKGIIQDRKFNHLTRLIGPLITDENECSKFDISDWKKTEPTRNWSVR